MKQGRKVTAIGRKKVKRYYILESGNPNNLLWGYFATIDENGVASSEANATNAWGAQNIVLKGGESGFMSSTENEVFKIIPNNQGYIANNYTFEGHAPLTAGLTGKYILCVEAYRQGTTNTPSIELKNSYETTVYGNIYVSATTATIYRAELEFAKDRRIICTAAKGSNLIITNIWLEEVG